MDYMIDKNSEIEGKVICGMRISNVDILKELYDKSVCFIVFPNIEEEVMREVEKYLEKLSTVIFALIDYETDKKRFYSESGEDLLFMQLIDRLELNDPVYFDVGVCHPIIRNNTYMFYENGYKNGILIEPNPDMCKLIKGYRPENILLNIGACMDESKSLKYYVSSNPLFRGHNTFDEKEAKKFGLIESQDIHVENINTIIEKYCKSIPDILDLDTEGMDYDLIKALNTEKYRIKMICVEVSVCGESLMNKLLNEKGYMHFTSTGINGIYLEKELW